MAAPVVITGAGQLHAFASTRAFSSARPVLLRVDGLAESEARRLAEQLNRDRTECGCSLGARAMTIGFLAAVVLLAVVYGPFTLDLLVRLPIAVGAAFVSAVAGKLTGILMAHRRARRAVVRLETRLASIN